VLDLCCGDGFLLTHLHARGVRAQGIDLSPGEVAAAQARGMNARVGRAQRLPYPRHRFDAVVSTWALMLLDDLELVLAEVLRVLRPGGRLHAVIGTGSPPVEGNRWPEVVDLIRATPRPGMVPLGDRRARDPDALAQLLAAAGFTGIDVEVHPYDLSGTAEQAVALADAMYDAAWMGSADRAAMAEAIRERLSPLTNPLYLGVMEVSCSAPAA